jgi:hypothetical protein
MDLRQTYEFFNWKIILKKNIIVIINV